MNEFYNECQLCLLDISSCECDEKHDNIIVRCMKCNEEASVQKLSKFKYPILVKCEACNISEQVGPEVYTKDSARRAVETLVYGFYHDDKRALTEILGVNEEGEIFNIFVRGDGDIDVSRYEDYDLDEEEGIDDIDGGCVETYEDTPSDEEVKEQVDFVLELAGFSI